MPINMPAPKQGGLGQMLTIGGAVAGGIFGGPAGAMAGASAGNMAGGILAPPKQAPAPLAAMQRRMDTTPQPSADLAQADEALKYLPPSYEQQFGPQIRQARELDKQGRTA